MTVRYALAPLPPVYAIHCARTGLYLAGLLTSAAREEYVARWGWEVVGIPAIHRTQAAESVLNREPQ
jgi:hypothetical protein